MKKTFLSLVVGLTLSGTAWADNLTQVYEQALANDPVIKRAKADRDSAFEGISLSRADLLPQISGYVQYTITDSTSANAVQQFGDNGQFEGFDFRLFEVENNTLARGIEARLSIYDHSNWVNLGRAEKVAQQSDSQYAAQLQELIVRVVTAYLSVLRAQDNVEFVSAEKRAIERQLEQTKQRFEVGLTAITDVHEAQANFDNTLAREIQAENDVEVALEDLRAITGKYHEGLHVLNTERFSATRPQPDTVDQWLEMAQDKNLELMAQRFAKDIAKDDIAAARAGHYPTAVLTASYEESDRDQTFGAQPEASLPPEDQLFMRLRVNVPFYQGNRVTTGTERAKLAFVSASEQMELTYRQTVQQVRSSFNDLRAATLRIRALEQSVVSAESALQATEAGFDVGTRTIVDVLNSTQNLFNARRNLAGARYDFIQSVVSLKRAAGTLTKQDIELINSGLSPQQS